MADWTLEPPQQQAPQAGWVIEQPPQQQKVQGWNIQQPAATSASSNDFIDPLSGIPAKRGAEALTKRAKAVAKWWEESPRRMREAREEEAAALREAEKKDPRALVASPKYRGLIENQALGLATGNLGRVTAEALAGKAAPKATPTPEPAPEGMTPPAENPQFKRISQLEQDRALEKAGEKAPGSPASSFSSMTGETIPLKETPKGMPTEGPLTSAPALTQPRKFEDQLFQLEANKDADRIEVMQKLKAIPEGTDPAIWEKLYHYEENPKGVRLTPEEQAVYDQHIKPITQESDRLSAELEGLGYPVEEEGVRPKSSEGYTPRRVAGRTRSFGEVLERWKQGVETRFGGASRTSFRRTTDSQKGRRFYNAVGPDGEKTVVYVAPDRKVIAFDGSGGSTELGNLASQGGPKTGAKVMKGGQTWTLEQATTQEIEGVAKIRYTKNVMANRLDELAKLRSAVRNAKFFEQVKASPEWPTVAVETKATSVPPTTNGKQWRAPKAVQFHSYYMEPALADAIDDALKTGRSLDELQTGLEHIGRYIKGSIFYNPLPHMKNVANHYLVEKGLVGTLTNLPGTGRTLIRAARAVATQDEVYMRALRAGASLPYARLITRDLHKVLLTKMGEDITKNRAAWERIAHFGGYANPINLIEGVYRVSSKALWSFGDILSVARQLELMERGIPLERAIKMTEEHMPNYRIPGQVLGQRWLAQTLKSPLFSMFGPYQYNRLASYMRMARDLSTAAAKGDVKLAAEMMDKLAFLGVMLAIWYPVMDKAWQSITGSEKAKVTRPGAVAVPQASIDLLRGDKDAPGALQSVFSLGPIETVPELYHGRYGWSGQPIAHLEDLRQGRDERFLRDLIGFLGSKIQPLGQAQRIEEGGMNWEQFALSQIGVQAPTERQITGKEKAKKYEQRFTARRAEKLESRRETGP